MRLVVAMAPALTMGFMVRSSLSSMAMTELKGSPVALTPRSSAARRSPAVAQTRANTKGFETLWIEKGTMASPTESTTPLVPVTLAPKASFEARARAGM